MSRSRAWATLCGLLFTLYLSGQIPVTGTVTSGGEALIGATVYEGDNPKNGTVTDATGMFTLVVDELPGDLIVSYLGYETQTYRLGGDAGATTVLIELTEGLNLSEVVVTALGLRRKNSELGYSVQQLETEALTDVQAVNFLDNLSGQIAGLRVTAGATGVGSTSQIVIRGETSFTNNNPLFVIDGVPINNNTIINRTDEAAAGFQEVDFGNGAMEVNPADVASVSVLKGASAAALYGARAANGVIVITTKRGGRQPGLGISFNSSLTAETPFQLPRYQNLYGQGQGGAFAFVDGLGGGISDNITYSYGPRLDAGINIPQFDSPVTLPDGRVVRGGDVAVHGGQAIPATPFISRPDNVKNVYGTGTTAINSISISGGGDYGDFRLSATDLRSNSYIPGVNLERKTLSGRFGFRPADRLRIDAGINYINSGSDNRPAGGYGSENVNYGLTAWLGRQTDTEVLKDYWQPGLEGIRQFSYNYTFFDNPYFTLRENRNSFGRDRLFGFMSASYEILENLKVSVRSGMDYSNEQRQFRRNFSSNRFPQGGYAENDVFFREVNTDILLDYATGFGDFTLDLLGGANRLQQEARNTQSNALTLAQPGVFRLSNAASPVVISDQTAEKRINSVYGLARLGFREYLFLDITGRNDWSSALATPTSADRTAFFYPSASLSFLASRAFSLPGVIDYLQLRANVAQVGNDTDPYRTSSTFVAQRPFDGQPTFSEQAVLAQPNLMPEQATSSEIGADIRLFDYRLGLDFTYFTQRTKNQILSLPIAQSSGYRQQIVNGGTVSSRGIEAILTTVPIATGKFRWTSRFNFSTSRAVVDELPAGTDRFTLSYSRVYNSVNQTVYFIVEPGGEIGDIWGTGYRKTEGGQFILDSDGALVADNTLRKIGNANPDFILGAQNNVRFGNVELGLLLDWRQGGELVSRSLSLAGVAGQLEETADRPASGIIIPGVQNTGTDQEPIYVPNDTPIDAERYYRSYYDRNHEENNVYAASYLKLREASITYRLDRGQLADTFLRGLESATVSLIGRNLYAWSQIPHFDPEQFAIQGQSIVFGVEDMTYPSARSFGLSLGLTF
ncbi:TonB-linked SusC/RagA family outer membrane protein [Lewinella aquimaris]|uniref:TonB-linked SusC/RagA family outer membrane protein n=1 Tax=Neolewinella aquimaris TaxID=1835722 RepID=A0A840DZ42_9BACT|nr:SusC/RagA family TonB-linked outer membrane protein [Neolewinella aquimaris]MBB4078170.1 TonB-linked SusC/RagA family outer membrane protein [Neolewinella aquimaris]